MKKKSKIAVVHVDSGWILQHIGVNLCGAHECFEAIPVNSLKNLTTDQATSYDGWYYVDIQNCFSPALKKMLPNVPHVGMFTHLHEDDWKNFKPHWADLDGVVHMNQRYCDIFHSYAVYDHPQMIVSRPGGDFGDLFEMKPVVFGVCQRGSDPNGNMLEGKGNGFLQEAINSLPTDIRQSICLSFKGDGWHPSDFDVANAWVHEGEDHGSYYEFYMGIDYLLVPSLWEGGPMAPLEAMYMGIPTISSRVGWMPDVFLEAGHRPACMELDRKGWVGEFNAGFLYDTGDVEDFHRVIEKVIRPKLSMRAVVEKMTYEQHAKDVFGLFQRIAHGKTKNNS